MSHFGDRLAGAISAHGPLCVGLDPYPERLPALFGAPGPAALTAFGAAVVGELAGAVAAIKPQIALFERFGPEGLAALAEITFAAREAGLIVLLDAKRGDIAATAAGYAEAYLGPRAWLHADAVTVNPFMGLDTLAPWLAYVREHGKGLAVLTRTSNPGAADLQDLMTDEGPVWARLAARLAPLVADHVAASGWSSIMLVVGATAPEEARELRGLVPAAPFLAPGFATQGAGGAAALAGAARGADGKPAGVLVNASRAVLYGEGATDADLDAWRAGFRGRLASAQRALQSAR